MAKKILLIEYEPRYLERIRSYLAGKDFELVVAKDGDEGLEAYRTSKPDLVVISSVLPKLRTPDVIKGMVALGSTPPIVLMMTGYKGKDKKADAQKVGATSILEKPFAEEAFLSEVSAMVGMSDSVFPGAADAPLLSADDIFSDVISGMEDDAKGSFPAPPGTDPGIQKKLEQTLSGILPGPKKLGGQTSGPIPRPEFAPGIAASILGSEKTARIEALIPPVQPQAPAVPAPAPVQPAAPGVSPAVRAAERTGPVKTDQTVDKMLTDTLSGLKVMRPEKLARPPAPAPVPVPVPTPVPVPAPVAAPSPAPEPVRDFVEKTTRMGSPLDRFSEPAPQPPAQPANFVPEPRQVPTPAPAPIPAPGSENLVFPEAAPSPFQPPAAPPAPEKKSGKRSGPVSTGDFGRYQLIEKIASGGMAEVFKARMRGEEGFEKIVAIKRILPHMADNDDFITMFIDEAKLAAQLNHNNIIHIYELGKVDAYHYIAMEYIDGMDLRTIIKLAKERDFPLPPELGVFIAAKVANALDYAHRRVGLDGRELNLIHRDVSPQNILISFEGDIKLCDFGIAKAATKVSQTQTGALKGKLQYMSPEQAWGKRLDKRTDIFSLGIVLYEMLTGDKLFMGDTDLTLLEQVRDAKASKPSEKNADVPERLDQVVLKALAKSQDERHQNASEFEKELNSVLYSFQPAPGPADLAIYMHRLMEASPAASEDQIDAAFAQAEAGGGAPYEPAKRGKGLVISKKAVTAITPASEVPQAPPEIETPDFAAVQEQQKGRGGLYAIIGAGVVIAIIAGFFLTRGKKEEQAAPQPTPVAATPAGAPEEVPTQAVPEAKLDERALQEEFRKRLAEEQKKLREMMKPAEGGPAVPGVPAPKGAVPGTAPTVSLGPKAPFEPPKAAEAPRIEPTAAPRAIPPTEPPRAAEVPPTPIPAQPAPAAAQVKEGDLVGEGEGVVPPRLVSLPPFSLPPQAREMARKRGGQGFDTMILALVDERGQVTESRILRSSTFQYIDDAALNAVKKAKIEPATKNGIKVKMWKAFPIRVAP